MSPANSVDRAINHGSLIPLQRPPSAHPSTSGISLTTFGLSADADLLWRALLRWPDVDRAELCERAGVDAERACAAAMELVERGFAESAPTALGVTATDPTIAIEHAAALEQRELASRLSQLSELRTHLPLLAEDYTRGRQRLDQELPIEVVDGVEATRSRLQLMSQSARVETLNLDHLSKPSGLAASRPEDIAMLARGVRARTIVQRDAMDNAEIFRGFALLAAAGEQIRVVDQVPERMIICDNELAVVPLDAADLYRGAIFIRVRTIIDLCTFLFERMWREATPTFGVPASDAPTGRPARVLELLAVGRKDEAIARSLDVGVRTVRRDIAVLMAQLGEHTRAATVAAAMRRGWLPP